MTRAPVLLTACALLAMPATAWAGGSVYLDPNTDEVIPVPTIVADWGIHNIEVGPTYDGVNVEANIGYYLCTANFQAAYPETEGYYLWSRSGNWDSIGLTVSHIKRVYDFLSDPVSWTETGAGQAARDKGMDDITQAGPTRCNASIGIEDLPIVPDFVSVSVGSEFRFNVNIHSGHDVVLNQYADIEQFNITNTAATFSVNASGTLRCRKGFNNAGMVFGPIQYIGGTGLTNSGWIQSAFDQIEGGLVNLPSAEIYCEGGSISGPFTNDGLFEVWEPTVIDTLSLSGGGSIVAKDTLTLRNSADPTTGVILEQSLTSHRWLHVDHPIQTPGATIAAEGSVVFNSLEGTMSVLDGKSLTFWGNIGQGGQIIIPAESTFAMPRTESYVCNNDGHIQVFGTMRLAGPASFPYNWGGNTFNNNGQIDLIGGEMIFSDFVSAHGHLRGPLMQGIGGIHLSGDSHLVNPRIVAMGPITIDATSKVIFNNDRTGDRSLCGAIENNGQISVAADALISGPLVNHGSIENTAGKLTYRGSHISGSGTIESTGGTLILETATGTPDPVQVENTIISRYRMETPNGFTTTGSGHVYAAERLIGGIGGNFSVLPGEYIRVYGSTFSPDAEIAVDGASTMFDWFTGTNHGRITATEGGTLQTCGASFNVANSGTITVQGAAFNLPGPGTSSGYTGQTLTNDGQIALDNAEMNFTAYNTIFNSYGPTITGSGTLEITNNSVIRNPKIAGAQQITIDETSTVEFNTAYSETRLLEGDITNHGTITFNNHGTIAGNLINHGQIVMNGGNVTLRLPSLSGTGTINSAPTELSLQSPDDSTPVEIQQTLTTRNRTLVPQGFTTSGNGVVHASGYWQGMVGGCLEVLPGELLTIYGGSSIDSTGEVAIDGAGTKVDWQTGTNAGQIQVTGGGTLQTRGANFTLANEGVINITDAVFSLPTPHNSYGYTGQVLTNNGLIDVGHSEMTFGYLSSVSGPIIQGNGQITIRSNSILREPKITGGTLLVDASSRIELTSGAAAVADLEQHGSLHIDGSSITFYGDWQSMHGSEVIASNGVWHTIYLHGDWMNRIDDPTDLQLPMTIVEASGGRETDPLLIEVCGEDLGDVSTGWQDNFALLKLRVSEGSYVRLVDFYDNQFDGLAATSTGGSHEALYLDYLELKPGAILEVGSLNVYYHTLQGDPSQIIVPEPALLSLLLFGFGGLHCRKHHSNHPGP